MLRNPISSFSPVCATKTHINYTNKHIRVHHLILFSFSPSGDQANGQDTSWDSRSVLAKFAREVTDRNISWAAVLGNHDDEVTNLDREELMQHLRMMPFSLAEPGPRDVAGFGNYVIKVRSPDP